MLTDQHEFIITTTDMHTIDLEPYQYSGTNITGVRLVDPENPMLLEITKYISDQLAENGKDEVEGLLPDKMRTQTALVYDAVLLLSEAVKQLDVGEQEDQLQPRKLTCNDVESWEHGNSITNFMRNVSIDEYELAVVFMSMFIVDGCARFDGRNSVRQRGPSQADLSRSGRVDVVRTGQSGQLELDRGSEYDTQLCVVRQRRRRIAEKSNVYRDYSVGKYV